MLPVLVNRDNILSVDAYECTDSGQHSFVFLFMENK